MGFTVRFMKWFQYLRSSRQCYSSLVRSQMQVFPDGDESKEAGPPKFHMDTWEFPKIRGTLFGILIIRILLFRVLY